jgi:phospholipid/cholesterol/gamma-HCH transport system substrate-binding protein
MTTTKSQKIRIGLFAVTAGTLLLIVLVSFAGVHFWKSRAHYNIVFDRTVYGLEVGSDVYLNGIRVGKVSSIDIASDDIDKVRVGIEIDKKTPVRTDTRAILQFAGITGLKVIDLRGGSFEAARLDPGGTITVGETALDKLERQAETMADESTKLLERANEIVSKADLIVGNLREITDPAHLGDIVKQTRQTAQNLAQATAALRGLIDENRAGLRSSIASIEQAARRASELVDGSDVRGAVADLRQASRSFKELAREVRQKPSRLLYSRPEPDRKLP